MKLLRAVDIGWIASLVVDRSDDLYAANGAGIWVFAPGAKRLIYTIRRGAGSAQALAFDRSGNLFAANIQARSVSVYAPTKRSGHMKWIREIHDGIDNPDALAFAPSGDLFVANLLPGNGFISVYPPGGSKPERRITSGVNSPWQLTVDSKGRLYVGNVPPNGILTAAGAAGYQFTRRETRNRSGRSPAGSTLHFLSQSAPRMTSTWAMRTTAIRKGM